MQAVINKSIKNRCKSMIQPLTVPKRTYRSAIDYSAQKLAKTGRKQHLTNICTVTYSRKPRTGKRVMKIVTNIALIRTDITVGKVFLHRFASIFSSQNHDTCSPVFAVKCKR